MPRSLPGPLVHALRALRTAGLRFLGPFDYAARALTGATDRPPLHLRRHVGPLAGFDRTGGEFAAYLKLLAGLKPVERILDLGCGCGQVALPVADWMAPEGSYVGVDIHRPSIEWCRANVARARPQFRFEHLDVHSAAYQRSGTTSAAAVRFPFGDASFDVILVKSVFTHMLPDGLENYLAEIARVLAPGGRCLATFFLLNGEQRSLASAGRGDFSFSFGSGVWRHEQEHSPESAVAFDEVYVMEQLAKRGLKLLRPPEYGSWAGRLGALSYQDILLIGPA